MKSGARPVSCSRRVATAAPWLGSSAMSMKATRAPLLEAKPSVSAAPMPEPPPVIEHRSALKLRIAGGWLHAGALPVHRFQLFCANPTENRFPLFRDLPERGVVSRVMNGLRGAVTSPRC